MGLLAEWALGPGLDKFLVAWDRVTQGTAGSGPVDPWLVLS